MSTKKTFLVHVCVGFRYIRFPIPTQGYWEIQVFAPSPDSTDWVQGLVGISLRTHENITFHVRVYSSIESKTTVYSPDVFSHETPKT